MHTIRDLTAYHGDDEEEEDEKEEEEDKKLFPTLGVFQVTKNFSIGQTPSGTVVKAGERLVKTPHDGPGRKAQCCPVTCLLPARQGNTGSSHGLVSMFQHPSPEAHTLPREEGLVSVQVQKKISQLYCTQLALPTEASVSPSVTWGLHCLSVLGGERLGERQ